MGQCVMWLSVCWICHVLCVSMCWMLFVMGDCVLWVIVCVAYDLFCVCVCVGVGGGAGMCFMSECVCWIGECICWTSHILWVNACVGYNFKIPSPLVCYLTMVMSFSS